MHYGARHYQRTSDSSVHPRLIEIAVFRETNKRLSEAGDEMARIAALNRNHKMWSILVKDVGLSSNPLPPVLKEDLLSIGFFSMQYSTLSITTSLPISPLLRINEQMIDGLGLQTAPAPMSPAWPAGDDRSAISA